MKFILLVTSLLTTQVYADTIISEREVTLPVDLSTARVKLSSRGYSTELVKVLIPELASVTIADHRNPGESAPCLANYEAYTAEEIIQGRPETISVPFKITLTKKTVIDEQKKVCKVSLKESIVGIIRGYKFVHDRQLAMPDRHVEDCQ